AVHTALTLIVDHWIVNDQRTAWANRLVRLVQEHCPDRLIPVMQDAPHDKHLGPRQLIGQKIARIERHPVGEKVLAYISCERRLKCWKVETSANDVPVNARYFDGYASLRRADIYNRAITIPRKYPR